MRKLTNKLFISILTVAFAVIALGTTTFAWFTLSNTATVSSFKATVTAGEGIEVSLDEENWYTTLSETVIERYLFGYDNGGTWVPGTLNPTKTTNFKLSAVTTEDLDTFTALGTDPVNYISFTLYFRSFADASPSIYWNGVTLSSEGVLWANDVDFTDSVNGTATPVTAEVLPVNRRYAANAARIAVMGDIDLVYEEVAGINGNTVLGAKEEVDMTDLPADSQGAIDYYTVKTGDAPVGSTSVTVPATTLAAGLKTLPVLVLDVPEYDGDEVRIAWTGSLTVNIWIEGWDQNCFNAILKDVLTIGLVFKTSNL